MMNKKAAVPIIVAFMLLAMLTASNIGTQSSYAKSISKASSNSSSTSPAPSPFNGKSIKIFLVSGFYNAKQWQPIDNLTSNGYDIKSIVPGKATFYIILAPKR